MGVLSSHHGLDWMMLVCVLHVGAMKWDETLHTTESARYASTSSQSVAMVMVAESVLELVVLVTVVHYPMILMMRQKMANDLEVTEC